MYETTNLQTNQLHTFYFKKNLFVWNPLNTFFLDVFLTIRLLRGICAQPQGTKYNNNFTVIQHYYHIFILNILCRAENTNIKSGEGVLEDTWNLSVYCKCFLYFEEINLQGILLNIMLALSFKWSLNGKYNQQFVD